MGKKTTLANSHKFGLLGKTLGYSFSKDYFLKKFKDLNIQTNSYSNYELKDESELALFLLDEAFVLKGFNVTIPYKETIIPYLDKLDKTAKDIQAVNTVCVTSNQLIGYNTDVYGFKKSLQPWLTSSHKSALIFGTGGASKAVAYALNLLDISYKYVSRNPLSDLILEYKDIDQSVLYEHQIIINCTPIGTYPLIDECLDLPYQYLSDIHIAYDLVYNPKESLFLKRAKAQGAITLNGLKMLKLQAEKSWEIWNK